MHLNSVNLAPHREQSATLNDINIVYLLNGTIVQNIAYYVLQT